MTTPDPADQNPSVSQALFERKYSVDGVKYDLPVVTVFGAGIAGLATAHELIERGFTVQVVEAAESKFGEYDCEIGGLAANQHSRVPASVEDLHGDVFKGYTQAEMECLHALRRESLSEAQPRFPLLETIRFDRATHAIGRKAKKSDADLCGAGYQTSHLEPDRAPPADWRLFWDDYGILNAVKLTNVLARLRDAYDHYLREFRDKVEHLSDIRWTRFMDAEHSEMAIREVLFVRITGYTDTDGTPEENRALAEYWASLVREELLARNALAPGQSMIPNLDKRLQVQIVGSANPKFDQATELGRRRSNRVEFEIVEQLIPGEHGFRFFPSFYRHLFDTMQRTPLLNEHADETGRTAYDQLVATPGAMLALNDGSAPVDVNLRNVGSLYQLNQALKVFRGRLGFDDQDMLGLQFFTARWMSSCALRRRTEGEPQNFVQYIGGRDRYSEGAWNFINEAPRALAAMSATESDARTQFDVAVQLMGMAPDQKERADMTLNGPTNTAWLDYWKTYLKMQGVRFFTGKLEKMAYDPEQEEFLPVVTGPTEARAPRSEDPFVDFIDPWNDGDLEHRFVMALSYQKVSDIVADAHAQAMKQRVPFTGPFRQLLEFDRQSGRRKVDGELETLECSAETGAPLGPYPLRTISGLQYFFPNRYRIGTGNLYFPDSPWGLTSISQFAYWRDRIKPVGQFLGQISVDVGDWHQFYPNGRSTVEYGESFDDRRGHCAWRSSTSEIALKTWDQIKNGLQHSLSEVMAPPAFFHIDKNIVFYESRPDGARANLVLRVVDLSEFCHPPEDTPPQPPVVFTLRRDLGTWSPFPDEGPLEQAYTVAFSSPPDVEQMAKYIAERINREHETRRGSFLAMAVLPEVPATRRLPGGLLGEILVSPYTEGTDFPIWLSTESDFSYLVGVDGTIHQLSFDVPDDDGIYGPEILHFDPPLPEGAEIIDVIVFDDGRAIRFTVTFPVSTSLAVANEDGLIEVMEGSRLSVETNRHNLQVVRQPTRGSGIQITTAVRCNVLFQFTRSGIISYEAPEPDRVYGLELSLQGRSVKVERRAGPDDTWEDLRDYFEQKLKQEAADLCLVRAADILRPVLMVSPGPEAGSPPRNTPSDGPKCLLVCSPLVAVSEVTITTSAVHGTAAVAGPVDLVIDDWHVELDAAGDPPQALRDRILQTILQAVSDGDVCAPEGREFLVSPVGETDIHLSLSGGDAAESGAAFRIGILNEHRMVELIGAPALEIVAKDIPLDLPKSAFVPFRNDGEFLINRPGQWKYRPGLYCARKNAFVSPHDPEPEDRVIHYAHTDCRALRDWVGAGTYMATYTRMTTMEAAAESARHAVVAILHEQITRDADTAADGHRVLPGSLPQIWDPEDEEPPDLIYLKEIDEELCRMGLPHMFDILGFTRQVLAILSLRGHDYGLAARLKETRGEVQRALLSQIGGLKPFLDLEAQMREKFASVTDSLGSSDGRDIAGLAATLLDRLADALKNAGGDGTRP